MSIAAAINVNQILTRVAVETGLSVVPDPFGSTSQEYVQLRALLQVAGEDLCLAYPWEFLKKTLAIPATSISGGTYAMPDDYLTLVDQTGWFDGSNDQIIGSLSPQEWNAVLNEDRILTTSVFRLTGGKIKFYPHPEPPQIAKFEYISRNFAKTDGVDGLDKATIVNGSDVILFDRTLITRYLKVLWLEAKGFDTSAAQNAFNQVFSFVTSKDTAGKVISPVRRGGFRLLDSYNAGETGFGL